MSELSTEQWMIIRDYLAQRAGLYLDDSRMRQGRMLVQERYRQLQISPAAYTLRIQDPTNGSELQWLAERLANHETQFFRNPAHFRALREHIFPELQRSRSPLRPLRCWSAGCSTGEEPYSMAMVGLQQWGNPPSRPISIWATDLSNVPLERAITAEYRGRSLANVQADYRQWFEQQANGALRVSEAVRSLVQFEQHNLLDALPHWAYQLDVVFCQNVTIYFQLETCRQLIERIYAAMAVGGYLLLGFSESLWGIFDRFETVEVAGAFIYRKGDGQPKPRPNLSERPITKPLNKPAEPALARPRPSTRPLAPASPSKPPDVTSLLDEARKLRGQGQQRRGLSLLASIAPNQRQPAILALAAQLHADLGQHEQAAAEARRALELDVLQDAAYVVLGMIELNQGAWDKAINYLERASYLVPDSPTIAFHLAESYRHQGRSTAALRYYQHALRKLAHHSSSTVIDGIAVGWLRSACERWIGGLEASQGTF
ncbi:CheR family methyltransferase [Herpetosiphon gulosus]|uniref:CheR-type methyltransferase domain-containing protein n=1 Tax=Herpetosiphon gulosus TaxID=1973496 RepID=A0ABP9WWG5_9CHLR